MATVIVDYGSGNLRSAAKALERAALEGDVGKSSAPAAVLVTDRPEEVARADRVVLPGVGAFGDCIKGLRALDGMEAALQEAVIVRGRPFLGICVGMQLLAERGVEYGVHRGLGWIAGEVVVLPPRDCRGAALKIPHMGWNAITLARNGHPLLDDLPSDPHFYFVHSYHFVATEEETVLAQFDYGGPRVAVVGRDNLVGTQFHPEKSQAAGLRLLANFLAWTP